MYGWGMRQHGRYFDLYLTQFAGRPSANGNNDSVPQKKPPAIPVVRQGRDGAEWRWLKRTASSPRQLARLTIHVWASWAFSEIKVKRVITITNCQNSDSIQIPRYFLASRAT